MIHKNYFEIIVRDNFDLGLKMGKLFENKKLMRVLKEFVRWVKEANSD